MKEIRDQFRKITALILAQAAVASGTRHASTTGKLRELIIQKFLRPHLPRTLDLRSGIIVDSTGNRSTQQDCIIVDTRLPIIDVGSETEGIIVAESVIATIEIKSYLNKKELISTLKACAKTTALVRNGEQAYVKSSVEIRVSKPLPINTYIFAYEGTDLLTLAGHIDKFAKERNDGGIIPEATCVLTKGVLQRSQLMPKVQGRRVTLPPIKEPQLMCQKYKKDCLFAFYRRLIDDVLPLKMRIYDIDSYYSTNELE